MSGAPRVHPLPSAAKVAALVSLRDGKLVRRPRPERGSKWADRYVGMPFAVKTHRNGYQSIRLDGVTLMVHRVIWALHHGAWPCGELDHLNGDRTDNQIENLRDGSKSENMRNQHVRSDSTSGFPGVHFCRDKKSRPWAARIGLNRTWKTLGYFATREEAIECRRREQARFGFSDRHGAPRPRPTTERAA